MEIFSVPEQALGNDRKLTQKGYAFETLYFPPDCISLREKDAFKQDTLFLYTKYARTQFSTRASMQYIH